MVFCAAINMLLSSLILSSNITTSQVHSPAHHDFIPTRQAEDFHRPARAFWSPIGHDFPAGDSLTVLQKCFLTRNPLGSAVLVLV